MNLFNLIRTFTLIVALITPWASLSLASTPSLPAPSFSIQEEPGTTTYAEIENADLTAKSGSAQEDWRSEFQENNGFKVKENFASIDLSPESTSGSPDVAYITLTATDWRISLNGTSLIKAVAYDIDHNPIENVPIEYYANNPEFFEVTKEGTVIPLRAGSEFVMARSGNVFSTPFQIQVLDSQYFIEDTVTGQVNFPASMVPQNPVLIGPSGEEINLEADGSFSINRYRNRNGLFMVLEKDNKVPLLIAMGRGFDEELDDENLTIDLRSTARALVFMHPEVFSDRPEVLEIYRIVSDQGAVVDELSNHLENLLQSRGSWIEGLADIDLLIKRGIDALSSGTERLIQDLTNTLQDMGISTEEIMLNNEFTGNSSSAWKNDPFFTSSTSMRPFKPVISPSYASGLKMSVTPIADSRTVDVEVNNIFRRHVALFLEKNLDTLGVSPSVVHGTVLDGFLFSWK